MPTKIKSKVVSRHKPKKTYKSKPKYKSKLKPKSKSKSKSKAKPKKHSKHSKHSKTNAIYTPSTESPASPASTTTINNQHHQQNIIDLITKFTQASKNVTKSQSNLPARLMKTRNVRSMRTVNNMHNMQKPQSYSKSVSSTYSRVMNNGHVHSEGKKVINDSTKPFVQIDELHNGHVDHYMVPRNTISNMPKQMLIPTPMSTPLPTVKIIKITSMYPIKKSTNKSKKLKNTKRK